MAHAAAISVKMSLIQLSITTDGSAAFRCLQPCFMSLYKMASAIQTIVFEENSVEEKCWEEEIRDLLWTQEDLIESFILSYLLSPEDISKYIPKMTQEIEFAIECMEKFVDNLKNRKENSIPLAVSDIPSIDDLPPVHKNKMIGLAAELEYVKELILGSSPQRQAISICGMGGTGKTSLATSIYNDLDVRNHFLIGAWVKISLQYSVRNILLNLLHTIEFFGIGRMKTDVINFILIEENDDEKLENFLRKIFALRRYIVIVDCVCDIDISSWEYIKTILPDSTYGSRIILLSRNQLHSDHEFVLGHYRKGFLDAPQSWNLLRQQVYGDEPCPDRALENIGKRIAENCQGLPLAIITVGAHLANEEKTIEYWNKVAESGNSVAYATNGAPMFEQLGLSYNLMPQHFRQIFLYMGAFPEQQEFSVLELVNLSAPEVLLEHEEFLTIKNLVIERLKYFLERDLIMKTQLFRSDTLTWSLHHALWHFCCNQAKKEEFFNVFEEYSTHGNDTKTYRKLRRLVIRKTVAFGIIESVNKIKNSEPYIRSLLFTGPYHPYPLTNILWGSYERLRVLNARSIRFYEFPSEILYLKLLGYLDVTLNGGVLPSAISRLSKLITLIVRFHHIVRSCEGGPSYLPMEIWEMRELAHLQVMGFDLPAPPSGAWLNLTTLLDVSPYSCTKEVLECLPYLIKLQISINFLPTRVSSPMCLFNHTLPQVWLLSVSVVIHNPYFEEINEPQVNPVIETISYSMQNIRTLSFTGCGFAWTSIEAFSQLRFLSAFELRCHAFRGPRWELSSKGFSHLEYFLMEDLDLEYWTARSGVHVFPCLRMITIKKCYKLEQIPYSFVHCHDFNTIEVLDSSHAAETWARSIHIELSETRIMSTIVAGERGKSFRTSTMQPIDADQRGLSMGFT